MIAIPLLALLSEVAPTAAADVPHLFSVASLMALFTLTIMEIVLGIDNIVFIAILSSKLPPEKRQAARRLGLLVAMAMRILLLLVIGWLAGLQEKWLVIELLDFKLAFSWRDLVLLLGGLFLLYKATHEIHTKLEGDQQVSATGAAIATMGGVIAQIMVMDLIFSIDSVITAIGMAQHVPVMIAAVVISIAVMMIFARPISEFVERHPTVKMLALSFLLLIGVMLVAESFGAHVSKGYIYFAMGFSLFVEFLNVRMRRKRVAPVSLHQPKMPVGG